MKRQLAFALVALSAAFLLTSPAQAQDGRWYRGETNNFVVYGQNDRQVEASAQALEDFDAALRLMTNLDAPPAANRLEVYLVRNDDELNQVIPRIGSFAAGFYTSSTEYIASISVYNQSQGFFRRQILFHEYAHHFMLHYFPNAYPKWYVEGWADFVSTVTFRDRRAILGEPSEARAYTMRDLEFIPPNDFLNPSREQDADPAFLTRFYAQSWFAAMYVSNHSDLQQGLIRYVAALGEGRDPVEAFQPSFGITPQEFENELRDFARGTARRVAYSLPPPATVRLYRLPRSADDLLLRNARMRLQRVSADEAEAFATQTEQIAARFPGDPFAIQVSARAALLRGDNATARARIEPLIAAGQDNATNNFIIAQSYLAEAEELEGDAADAATREARRYLVRGFRQDPNDFATLYLYVSTYALGLLNEEQLNVMARALELAPQVDTIRINLGTQLLASERYDEAATTLRPLMFNPHEPVIARYTRALMAAALRREQPDPDEIRAAFDAAEAED